MAVISSEQPVFPMKKGDSGHKVHVLQGLLITLGFNAPSIVRGRFIVETEIGVNQLRSELGLRTTGIFDEELNAGLMSKGIDFLALLKLARPTGPYSVAKLPRDVA